MGGAPKTVTVISRNAEFGYSIVDLEITLWLNISIGRNISVSIYVATPVKFGNEAVAILIGKVGSFHDNTEIVASPTNSIVSSP